MEKALFVTFLVLVLLLGLLFAWGGIGLGLNPSYFGSGGHAIVDTPTGSKVFGLAVLLPAGISLVGLSLLGLFVWDDGALRW